MQGLLTRARQHGAAALDRAAQIRNSTNIDGSESSDAGGGTAAYTVIEGGDAALQAVLKRVTHGNTATVPREALREVERMADLSEDALAVVLKHIEETVRVPPNEWRKIHGALKLMEQLLRSSEKESALVGKVWFEVKMLARLDELVDFKYDEDSRVALLIKRTASSVRHAAEQTILTEQDSPGSSATASFPAELSRNEADAPVEQKHQNSGDEYDSGNVNGQVSGRWKASSTAITNGQMIGRPLADHPFPELEPKVPDRKGKRDPKDEDEDDDPCETAFRVIAERRRKAETLEALDPPATPTSSGTISGGSAAVPPPRRCCRCLWPWSARTASVQEIQVAHPSEVAKLIK